jgi:hypothetical protein
MEGQILTNRGASFCMLLKLLLVFSIAIATAGTTHPIAHLDVYISNLNGNTNGTITGSYNFGLVWLKLDTTQKNNTQLQIFHSMLNSTSVSVTTSPTRTLVFPNPSYNFLNMNLNISNEEQTYLLRSFWNIRVASPQFPNGEISGNLSKSNSGKN